MRCKARFFKHRFHLSPAPTYAEQVGNVERDALGAIPVPTPIRGHFFSTNKPLLVGMDPPPRTGVPEAQKYYHFVRLMGRSASHIALEVR